MNLDHPAFAPYRALIHELGLATSLPTLDRLNALATARHTIQANGFPLRFIAPDGRVSARAYETHILQTGQIPTRANTWHDVMNALVWLRFPRFKAAINKAHGEALAQETDARRGRRRDAMTVLDESGVWVISQDPALSSMLSERAWTPLFSDRRTEVETKMRFVMVGHALLEKMLAPYPSITGKCLHLISPSLDLDTAEENAIDKLDGIQLPGQLSPLPVQGIPGWDADNVHAAYYANQAIFRPA